MMAALILAGLGLCALFYFGNLALERLDAALDAAFNGDRQP
jgi:hypothetical protein